MNAPEDVNKLHEDSSCRLLVVCSSCLSYRSSTDRPTSRADTAGDAAAAAAAERESTLCSTLADQPTGRWRAMCLSRQMHAPPLDFTHRRHRSLTLWLSAIDRFGSVGRQTGVRSGRVGRSAAAAACSISRRRPVLASRVRHGGRRATRRRSFVIARCQSSVGRADGRCTCV